MKEYKEASDIQGREEVLMKILMKNLPEEEVEELLQEWEANGFTGKDKLEGINETWEKVLEMSKLKYEEEEAQKLEKKREKEEKR